MLKSRVLILTEVQVTVLVSASSLYFAVQSGQRGMNSTDPHIAAQHASNERKLFSVGLCECVRFYAIIALPQSQ